MTFEEYARLYPEAAQPTYQGARPGLGRVVVGTQYPGEGYAIIKCGETEVQVGYTLLHHVRLMIDRDTSRFSELAALQKALDSITCEASLGHTGD